MIVLPGLIETHWHMWNTLLRSMSGEKPELGYFRTTAALGQKYEARDMYQGTRLAAAEAINSGITFVHNWCHNIRSPEYAEPDLRALRESGPACALLLLADAGASEHPADRAGGSQATAHDWDRYSSEGLITLGMAWRGQGGNNPATAVPPEIYIKEIETAGGSAFRSRCMPAARARPPARSTASPRPNLLGQGHADHPWHRAQPEEMRRSRLPAPR